jgi:hypothetical protein
MITSTSKKMIQGALKFITTIVYTDGSSTVKTLNSKTMIPESIVFIDKFGNKKESF